MPVSSPVLSRSSDDIEHLTNLMANESHSPKCSLGEGVNGGNCAGVKG